MNPALPRHPTVRQKEILFALTQGYCIVQLELWDSMRGNHYGLRCPTPRQRAILNTLTSAALPEFPSPLDSRHCRVRPQTIGKMHRLGWIREQRPFKEHLGQNAWFSITTAGRAALRGYR